MKIGAENRKQLKILAIFGSLALVCGIYEVVSTSSSPASAPTPAPAPVTATQTPAPVRTSTATTSATKLSNAQLDPTLHMEGMLLAEAVEYNGTGRNIFSAQSTAPLASIPNPIASARPGGRNRPVVAPPVNMGPPPPPPIDLRFFGTATRANGNRQAFFLKGDDVFLASPGDVVGRRYRINSISATSADVTDLQTNNTQRLPLQMQ